jgi:mono/diheme cytochrome c family protein
MRRRDPGLRLFAPLTGALAAMLLVVPPQARAQDQQDSGLIARGRYLATVGDCGACHTKPGGPPMAGGRPLETPFGNVIAPNITPDQETGIGGWTEAQFYAALHDGIAPRGHLYPAMPYVYYSKATRADVAAIRAWLGTLPPVVNKVMPNQLPFPFNIRASMAGWDTLFFKAGTWQDRPDKSAEWNRGGYLVEGLGHCGACHTGKNALGGDDAPLQGYALQGWFAPAISADAPDGIATWSADDLVEYLKTGTNRFTGASGPMAEEVEHSTSKWTLADLRAAAAYLKDQHGPSRQPAQPVAANDPAMQAGAAIYADQCAACHTLNGKGIARLFPTLAGGTGVQARQPDSVLRVILQGTRVVGTSLAPTAPGMPAFGWKLSDPQVAAVATYVRNAWGNVAPAVSASEVASTRRDLRHRAE